jgi:ABC-2 type transport system permease protein
MNTFKWLLKREFWESKGGFFWAPMIAGLVFIGINIMGFITALVLGSRQNMQVSGVNISELTRDVLAEDLVALGQGLDMSLYMAATWPLMVLPFVVFFYCLGALYDDRRDRSVLFWKSLPISDRDTVLSKAVTATLTAPIIAIVAAVLTMLAFLVVLSVFVLAHGGNPFTLVLGPASPLKVAFNVLMWIPVYAVWALPAVGWLMLCSAWARTKPFLWAVMLPLFAWVLVAWFGLMRVFDLGAGWFGMNIVGRALLSVAPGTDLLYRDWSQLANMRGPEDFLHLFSAGFAFESFALPHMWIGALAGAVMLVIAIRLRRWRDEG